MPRRLDRDELWRQLSRLLERGGTSSAPELTRQLGISQATFSRLAADRAADLFVTGRGRSTRYAVRRAISEVEPEPPIYEVDAAAAARRIARLVPLAGGRYHVEPEVPEVERRSYDDLPHFVQELCPSGFLGRVVPRLHPELGHPADVRLWSAEQSLRYLCRFGSNLPGNLIVGAAAFELHLEALRSPPPPVPRARRGRSYAAIASDLLRAAPPGASAGGEQPKFLARRGPDGVEVLVKFSPPAGDRVARRWADLLVCEHLAHRTLAEHGQSAARSALVRGSGRVFLEIERFDRVGAGGRRGVLSLLALDAEFVRRLQSWTDSAEGLARAGHISAASVERLRWLELFGALIANTDMHAGNASFFCRATRTAGLAPAYDMLPMHYAPLHGELVDRPFGAPTPSPSLASVWTSACRAAADFWKAVAQHRLIAPELRAIASQNRGEVERALQEGRCLPRG